MKESSLYSMDLYYCILTTSSFTQNTVQAGVYFTLYLASPKAQEKKQATAAAVWAFSFAHFLPVCNTRMS